MTEKSIQAVLADTPLKITALLGASSAVVTIGYNYYLCNSGSWHAILSVPVFIVTLALLVTALGLLDEIFGTFRNINIWAGKIIPSSASFVLAYFFSKEFVQPSTAYHLRCKTS